MVSSGGGALLGEGAGSKAMLRIAAPMVGGLVSGALLTLAAIPAAYVPGEAAGN
jgi:copper/silver efflux system protein